jgi:hypothetical protein
MLLWGMNPRKVLYGTDWPLATMESYLQFVEELKMPPKDRALMSYENAAALFKLDIPAAPTGFGALLRGI